jgi:hypothetical protein
LGIWLGETSVITFCIPVWHEKRDVSVMQLQARATPKCQYLMLVYHRKGMVYASPSFDQ